MRLHDRIDRRGWLRRAAALALGALPLGGAMASPEIFPSRPVTLWVPWPAGGATDVSLRLLAELASVWLGQPVLTENRGGAGGTLAMPVLQQARPDGYTVAQMPQPVFRVPHTQKVLWDPIRDVTPIIQVSGVTFGVLAAAASRIRSLDDLFAFARARPGELTIATNGIGTTPHMVLEELLTARGLRYIHVPYKGTAEQLNAIAGGQVMAGVNSTGFGPAVDTGTLRLLVTFGAERSKRWPEVPVLRELGFDIVAKSPFGLAGPRGLPPGVVTVLHEAFKKAMFDQRFKDELAKYDQEIDYLGPEAYAQSCREIFAQERAMVDKLGLARAGS
ncbi:Tripartite-type tricarboxylate transporter, receptor component TctC [Variovorax sp. CF079]|uniref:tripartite tricarboxylate transporter substrate binding protein n=1 Tax=Variovorax sp. CF079 TaxID=1882774 RepID=UPI000880E9FB|nr:tripartite tricarboxylate transporter substrate binding protein [Variovorax sp. CF079]SDE43444.1 Tripartite-type tricarboxylate transporter, receptor component TctC [Variovorax sp. CF079]